MGGAGGDAGGNVGGSAGEMEGAGSGDDEQAGPSAGPSRDNLVMPPPTYLGKASTAFMDESIFKQNHITRAKSLQ